MWNRLNEKLPVVLCPWGLQYKIFLSTNMNAIVFFFIYGTQDVLAVMGPSGAGVRRLFSLSP